VTLCLFLMLFALESALIKKKISEEEYLAYCEEIKLAFTCHKEMYDAVNRFYEANQKDLLSMQHVYICSNGANLGVAMEGALKIGETVQIPSFEYEIEEFIHGPNLQLTPNYPIFFIDNNDETSDRIGQIYYATLTVSDKVFMISNKREGKRIISIPHQTSSFISPLYNVVAFQFLAYKITEDLHKWKKHPLFDKFEKAVQCKSDNYKNSALASED
ncbi:MAG: SIS domain-containing protein, partial [Erysipelotrichia bacterium]|nr:SIS domain-containing protein [Erysipelotrichia bacterium]